MMPPGYHPEWHLGVRVKSTKKLVAFISGVPVRLHVRETYDLLNTILLQVTQVILKVDSHVRDQLPVRPQKIAFETPGSSPHQRSDSSMPSQGNFPSDIHGWCRPPHTSVHLSVSSLRETPRRRDGPSQESARPSRYSGISIDH